MPYVSVHVDTCDVLDDLSDQELEAELIRRRQRHGAKSGSPGDYAIPQKAARYTLEEAAGVLHAARRPGVQARGDQNRLRGFFMTVRNELAALKHDNARLMDTCVELLQALTVSGNTLRLTLELYGKPGGPWNVPGSPGGWLTQVRTALAEIEGSGPLPKSGA